MPQASSQKEQDTSSQAPGMNNRVFGRAPKTTTLAQNRHPRAPRQHPQTRPQASQRLPETRFRRAAAESAYQKIHACKLVEQTRNLYMYEEGSLIESFLSAEEKIIQEGASSSWQHSADSGICSNDTASSQSSVEPRKRAKYPVVTQSGKDNKSSARHAVAWNLRTPAMNVATGASSLIPALSSHGSLQEGTKHKKVEEEGRAKVGKERGVARGKDTLMQQHQLAPKKKIDEQLKKAKQKREMVMKENVKPSNSKAKEDYGTMSQMGKMVGSKMTSKQLAPLGSLQRPNIAKELQTDDEASTPLLPAASLNRGALDATFDVEEKKKPGTKAIPRYPHVASGVQSRMVMRNGDEVVISTTPRAVATVHLHAAPSRRVQLVVQAGDAVVISTTTGAVNTLSKTDYLTSTPTSILGRRVVLTPEVASKIPVAQNRGSGRRRRMSQFSPEETIAMTPARVNDYGLDHLAYTANDETPEEDPDAPSKCIPNWAKSRKYLKTRALDSFKIHEVHPQKCRQPKLKRLFPGYECHGKPRGTSAAWSSPLWDDSIGESADVSSTPSVGKLR
ncbi:unnamed protein product [Darwinula stevensoni]|uniref:Inner centromere protein ARK-binding domain-containing protein n=1 Tax=Darwinula stevensoni TaxID=69355 RepID=A0A7R9ABV7_9CRUS|nr:unnamed protein product [Darwinula stevensoni]CAG0899813.1 unnamed protein product [Darwinula stevensoni]